MLRRRFPRPSRAWRSRARQEACTRIPPPLYLLSQHPIEIERGADECEVGERLREVAERLSERSGLFGEEAEMVGVSEHLLEHEPRLVEPRRVIGTCACERLDEPEAADVEGSLLTVESVGRLRDVVPEGEAVRDETSFFGAPQRR